jgi:HD superfamily phosphohydrolase YqeK
MTEKIIYEMIRFFGADVKRIGHALKVYAYTDTIARLEGFGADMRETAVYAAVLHDVGIKIAEEKQIILNVVKKEQKNDIMKAIMAGAGIHSKAHSVVFSLPVSSGAGLSMFDV